MLSGWCLTLVMLPQGEAPLKAEAKPVEASAPRVLDDKEAREAAARFIKVIDAKKASLAERLQAVEDIAQVRHASFVKLLSRVVQKDQALTIRKAAATSLANQPPAQARAAIVSLLKDRAIQKTPVVAGVLVQGLGVAGYEAQDWPVLEDLFLQDFAEAYHPLQKAVLQLIAKSREKQAWRTLVEHLDEPIPEDVDGAANPPAEYWEARWKAWRAWRGDLIEALFAVTGQRFGSRKEAEAWIKANGGKQGLK